MLCMRLHFCKVVPGQENINSTGIVMPMNCSALAYIGNAYRDKLLVHQSCLLGRDSGEEIHIPQATSPDVST